MHTSSKLALVLISTAIALQSTTVHSQETTSSQARRPVITLKESTRMRRVNKSIWSLNSLNPVFVLYDDGLVIFKKDKAQVEYSSVDLGPQEMKTLMEKFKIDEFLKLDNSYSTNNEFNQPVNFIKYWQGSKVKKVRVIGTIRDDEKDRSNSPKAFLHLFDQVISFKHKNAHTWVPYKLKISLYPQTNSQGEPVLWPSDWPDLNHKTTKKRTDPDLSHSYELYLDGIHKEKLEQMLSKLKTNQAVSINGKPWYIAPVRYILPNEKMWDTEKSKGVWDTIKKAFK